ncbi:unnamed protein product [Echinostoma caproni]|uniref:Endo/exonuclease/phosphatase domain-containing protein n=1 Tax=Echinostoma caproni TaxID=27848 RepID=A0A183B6R6_9TREM|nr:unnamed protein product [Echinostoma caproni]
MGGGVMQFIHESVPVTHLYSYGDPDGQREAPWCKTKLRCNGYTTIGVCYRPPATDPMANLDDMRPRAGDGYCLILVGFNVPIIDWDDNRCLPGADQFSRDLLEEANQLTLHSREPTAINDSAQSVLDLVLSPRTSDDDVIYHLPPLGLSDHLTLSMHW